MGIFWTALQAIAALPQILNDIKAAISSVESSIQASQNAKFQAALADFQQKISSAHNPKDYQDAAQALHHTLSRL